MVIEFYNYLHNRTYLFIHRVTVSLILSSMQSLRICQIALSLHVPFHKGCVFMNSNKT